ncbi:DUF6270 domain-containing protein [Actinomyces ruminis]|nr:DUF6270 domain-containing protein [Actinomyces ruminis]
MPDAGRTVSVFGSCVSRDTVEVLRRQGWRVGAYVARQSLLSAGSQAPAHALDLGGFDSAFVRRVHAEGLAGDRRSRLAAAAPDTDVLLWDIVMSGWACWNWPTSAWPAAHCCCRQRERWRTRTSRPLTCWQNSLRSHPQPASRTQ